MGGLNLYAYVEGNLVISVDPLGLDRWGDDPSLKQIPVDDKAVEKWLCTAD